MADRFWSGGIGLPSKAVSLQAARPILVARRAASSVRLGRSQTQSSLGSTLELGLIKNSIKMRPCFTLTSFSACRATSVTAPVVQISARHRDGFLTGHLAAKNAG